jgi:transketolase
MEQNMTSIDFKSIKSKKLDFGPRRGNYYDVNDILKAGLLMNQDEINLFEKMDLIYRTLCGIMFNFVPTSGHPGGSISSGRIVESIIYKIADYDIKNPFADDNDMIVYAAGHKALGLYSMWALRNELVRAYSPEQLPADKFQKKSHNNLTTFHKI